MEPAVNKLIENQSIYNVVYTIKKNSDTKKQILTPFW